MLKKRHLALQGRVSSRDPAVPVRGVRRCSCSRVAIPSRDPGTRLQEQQIVSPLKTGGHPPARATNTRTGRTTDPKTSGHQPKDWAGRGYFFDTVGPHVFILDIGGYVSEVARGSGIITAP